MFSAAPAASGAAVPMSMAISAASDLSRLITRPVSCFTLSSYADFVDATEAIASRRTPLQM